MTTTYQYQSDFARMYVAEGLAQGEAMALLTVLRRRGIEVPADVEARITECTDAEQLTEWIGRAATARTLDEVFG